VREIECVRVREKGGGGEKVGEREREERWVLLLERQWLSQVLSSELSEVSGCE